MVFFIICLSGPGILVIFVLIYAHNVSCIPTLDTAFKLRIKKYVEKDTLSTNRLPLYK